MSGPASDWLLCVFRTGTSMYGENYTCRTKCCTRPRGGCFENEFLSNLLSDQGSCRFRRHPLPCRLSEVISPLAMLGYFISHFSGLLSAQLCRRLGELELCHKIPVSRPGGEAAKISPLWLLQLCRRSSRSLCRRRACWWRSELCRDRLHGLLRPLPR